MHCHWWRERAGRWGGILLLVLMAVGVGAPFLAPYDPRYQDRSSFYHPPALPHEDCRTDWFTVDDMGRRHLFGFDGCGVHLLGTDALGRDMLSRVIYGARWSVSAAVLGVTFTVAFGVLVGAVAGFAGGVTVSRYTSYAMRLGSCIIKAVDNIFGTATE